jgi:ABC-type molybdate transport system permease subunit
MNFILDRLKEPSSWASLASILAAFGIVLPPEVVGYAIPVATGIFGLIGFFLKEKSRRQPVKAGHGAFLE